MAKKNSAPLPSDIAAKGNPMFNLSDAEPVDPAWQDTDKVQAPGAITAEDLALDMELSRMANEEILPDVEQDLTPKPTKQKMLFNHLSEQVESYSAAITFNELERHVAMAKQLGCDAVDASEAVIRTFVGKKDPIAMGFITYKDIFVCLPEKFSGIESQMKETAEQKMFGQSKVK